MPGAKSTKFTLQYVRCNQAGSPAPDAAAAAAAVPVVAAELPVVPVAAQHDWRLEGNDVHRAPRALLAATSTV